MKFLCISLLLLLCSCLTPRQKLGKLIAEHPELISEYRPDTLRAQVITPYFALERPISLGDDTTRTHNSNNGEQKPDSLVIDEVPGVRVVFRGKAKGTLKVQRLADTLNIQRVVQTPLLRMEEPTPSQSTLWTILIGSLILILILRLLIEKKQ